jgi:hypothetical protein
LISLFVPVFYCTQCVSLTCCCVRFSMSRVAPAFGASVWRCADAPCGYLSSTRPRLHAIGACYVLLSERPSTGLSSSRRRVSGPVCMTSGGELRSEALRRPRGRWGGRVARIYDTDVSLL